MWSPGSSTNRLLASITVCAPRTNSSDPFRLGTEPRKSAFESVLPASKTRPATHTRPSTQTPIPSAVLECLVVFARSRVRTGCWASRLVVVGALGGAASVSAGSPRANPAAARGTAEVRASPGTTRGCTAGSDSGLCRHRGRPGHRPRAGGWLGRGSQRAHRAGTSRVR